MQSLANERREKTLKALKYIRKYQHLYQSTNEASDQRSESKLLQQAERQLGERLRPVSPDQVEGQQKMFIKAAKPSKSKGYATNGSQQSSWLQPDSRQGLSTVYHSKPKVGHPYTQAGRLPGVAEKFKEPSTYHLLPSSHAQAQQQHHNEILAQIAGSRGEQQLNNR